MIAETLSQNVLAITSNDMTLQLYAIEYFDNRITNKFIKNTEYYRGVNNEKFTDFIDTLFTITTCIPKIKDLIIKDYNSIEFGKLEFIILNDNKNKLLRKYISSVNKDICEFNSTIENHCDSWLNLKRRYLKCNKNKLLRKYISNLN
jgi:hypothetical protein